MSEQTKKIISAIEAGALITDFSGKMVSDKESIFVVSNGSSIHQKLLEVVK